MIHTSTNFINLKFNFVVIRERHRRYKIMREHGLILPNHTRSWFAKYVEAIGLKNGKQFGNGRFLAFMQLTKGMEFDKIVEGLQYEHDLRKFIFKLVFRQNYFTNNFQLKFDHVSIRLYELRSNGIKSFHGGRLFHKLKSERMSKVRRKPSVTWEWKHLVPTETLTGTSEIIKHCISLNSLPIKRKSTPLSIIGSFQ